MLFNSIGFTVFFVVVFLLYWLVFTSRKQQNVLLLVSSFFFYGCWDWRFLFLLMFSIALDYYSAHKIAENENRNRRKTWLFISIGINLGFLGVFKYYNFFIESFADFLNIADSHSSHWLLQIILPVGISFYTFHGLSYIIDVYKKRIEPVKDKVDYAVFVSYFPLLVAGPIERAMHLLPQIQRNRKFDYDKAVSGSRQILWGLVKKIVIADGCAEYVNPIFENPSEYSGSSLLVCAVLFSFQIYGDFSGYSDIALGTSRLLGIELLKNFSYPYFSRDIAEFWRKWHISLSSWFRDYVYIPLGGSRGSLLQKIRNTFVIFLLSGFWHGANWTFVVWGFLHALYFIPYLIVGTNRKNIGIIASARILPDLKTFLSMGFTFALVTFAWIFFRAETIADAIDYIFILFSPTIFALPEIFPKTLLSWIFLFTVIEWFGRKDDFAIESLPLSWNKIVRFAFYYLLVILVLYYSGKDFQFIYFQF